MSKKTTKIMLCVLALAFVLFVAGCSRKDDGAVSPVDTPAVTLDTTEYTGEEETSFALKASVSPAGTVKWSSSNRRIATVSDGVVFLKSQGTAVITAACGEASATCTVTVTAASFKPFEVFKSNKNEYNLALTGNGVALDFSLYSIDEEGNAVKTDGEKINYTVENERFATVENGIILPHRTGVTTVTATCGEYTASAAVTVYTDFIDTASKWNTMLSKRNNLAERYLLVADLDFAGKDYGGMSTKTPTALASADRFSATVNGNGHTLKNITLTGAAGEYLSLFGCLHNAKISKIAFENVRFTGGGNASGIATVLSGNSVQISDVSLDMQFQNGGEKNLLAHTAGGSASGLVARAEHADGVRLFANGSMAAQNAYVLANVGVAAGFRVFSEKMDVIWAINGDKVLDVSVWTYAITELPRLKANI